MTPAAVAAIAAVIVLWIAFVAVLIAEASRLRRPPRPEPAGEACEHYDHEARKPCPNPATHELSETWLEPEFGHGAGTGCTAYFCAEHAPVGAQPIA